jgi:hypothetical protein
MEMLALYTWNNGEPPESGNFEAGGAHAMHPARIGRNADLPSFFSPKNKY